MSMARTEKTGIIRIEKLRQKQKKKGYVNVSV